MMKYFLAQQDYNQKETLDYIQLMILCFLSPECMRFNAKSASTGSDNNNALEKTMLGTFVDIIDT